MAAVKGQSKPQHTEEQKAGLVERICLLYESQHITAESACESVGLSYRAFKYWLAENSEFSERYKKAKQNQESAYWEELIKPLSKRALQKHLEIEVAEDESDVVYQGVISKDPETNAPLKQRSKKWVLPNPTITIFALKGLYPEKFSEKHEITGKDGAPLNAGAESKLSVDELATLVALMKKAKEGE